MSKISLDAPLQFAAPAAHRALREALGASTEGSQTGAVALSAAIRIPGAGEAATVSVPVVIDSNAATAQSGAPIELSIHARTAPAAFPTFTGDIAVDAVDRATSRVRMRGEYTVPFGSLGGLANAVLLGPLAEDGLRQFFIELVAQAEAVMRKESETLYREMRER